MFVRSYNWATWLDARSRMPEIWSGWKDDHDHAHRAMTNSLRRGKVPVRGFARVEDSYGRPVEIQATSIAPYLVGITESRLCEYEVTRRFSGRKMNSPPSIVTTIERLPIEGFELAWDEFRADLIRWELPIGAVPNSLEWPTHEETISFREAAELIAPFLPPGPITKRHQMADAERDRVAGIGQPTPEERQRLVDDARLRGDFDAWAQAIRQPEEPDTGVRDALVSNHRTIELRGLLLEEARRLKIRMRHPTLGLSVGGPDVDWHIDREGFNVLVAALLDQEEEEDQTPVENRPAPRGEAKPKKKPGPHPHVREGIRDKMLRDLQSGRRTVLELEDDTLPALAAAYGGSLNTADAARKEAIKIQSSNSENL